MVDPGGTSGQWIRTHNEDSAKLFLAEMERENPPPRRTPRQRRILIGVFALAILAVTLLSLVS